MDTVKHYLSNLTWDDLRQMAGSKILNRGKSYTNRVTELSTMNDNGLIAWVSGGRKYAAYIEFDEDGDPGWFCSCPYDWQGPCKHVIAVLLAGVDRLKVNEDIPPIDVNGELFQALINDTVEEFGLPEEDEDNEDELVELLLELADRYPEVKRKITEDEQLRKGNVTLS